MQSSKVAYESCERRAEPSMNDSHASSHLSPSTSDHVDTDEALADHMSHVVSYTTHATYCGSALPA